MGNIINCSILKALSSSVVISLTGAGVGDRVEVAEKCCCQNHFIEILIG